MDWDAGVRPLCPGGTGGSDTKCPNHQDTAAYIYLINRNIRYDYHMMHDNEHDKVIQKDCEK